MTTEEMTEFNQTLKLVDAYKSIAAKHADIGETLKKVAQDWRDDEKVQSLLIFEAEREFSTASAWLSASELLLLKTHLKGALKK